MLGAPMGRLMAAQWWQIIDDRWYPYLPEEKVYWFESVENIDASAKALLDRIRQLGKERYKNSQYWFPSPTQSSNPITSTQGLWRDTFDSLGSRHYPLAGFARSYRNPNNPTYAMTAVRQFGALFRELGNAAEVSKELERRARKYSSAGI